MSLLIGLGLVLCVCLSEVVQPAPPGDLRLVLGALALVAISVPGMAWFQVWYLSHSKRHRVNHEQWGARVERMVHWNSVVWLVASLVIVVGLRWPTVVRNQWGLDRWPLLDEALVILPSLLALVAAWWVQARCFPSPYSGDDEPSDVEAKRPRRGCDPASWMGVQFRIRYLLPAVLMPLLLGVLLKDAVALNGGPLWMLVALVMAGLAIVFYPLVVIRIWPTRPLPPSELKAALEEFLQSERTGVREIRVLESDGCFLAALTLGLVPGTRIVLLTDTLLNEFSDAAVAATVRHEAAHIRRHHFGKRLVFLFLPLLVLVAAVAVGGILAGRELEFLQTLWWAPVVGYKAGFTLLAVILAYACYLVLAVGPRLHRMELEADELAGGSIGALRAGLQEALLRFAAYQPTRWDRDSWTHPSFARRIQRLEQLAKGAGASPA